MLHLQSSRRHLIAVRNISNLQADKTTLPMLAVNVKIGESKLAHSAIDT